MTIFYTATDANGGKHTRRTDSDRLYTHTVVVRPSKEAAVEAANARVAQDIRGAAGRFHEVAKGQDAYVDAGVRQFPRLGRDYFMNRFMEELAFTTKWGTPEAYAADQHMENIDKIEKTDWTRWGSVGWCGRLDLAQKLAAQQGAAEVAILPAVVEREVIRKRKA